MRPIQPPILFIVVFAAVMLTAFLLLAGLAYRRRRKQQPSPWPSSGPRPRPPSAAAGLPCHTRRPPSTAARASRRLSSLVNHWKSLEASPMTSPQRSGETAAMMVKKQQLELGQCAGSRESGSNRTVQTCLLETSVP